MAAENPDRLAFFNKRGVLSAKLNYTKLDEIKTYARVLGVRLKNGEKYKNKKTFIDEIIAKVEEKEDKIYKDWMKRVDSGRPIWNQYILDPYHHYSLKELHNIVKNLGIPTYQ